MNINFLFRDAAPGKDWQKRVTGCLYSSPSGVGTEIDQLTGKMLDYDLCVTHCAIFHSARKAKSDAKPHNCKKNWTKSTKAMHGIVKLTGAFMMKNIEDVFRVPVDVLIMDDDAASLSRPNKSIAPSSSAVTGLTANGNMLFYKGKPVHTVTSETAFQSFVLWLEQYSQVMQVAHNGKLFDARRPIKTCPN
ncbi:unnamed protein product [Mytilus coruscus]|uniref:Mutator-like transposase domain-containing protein n=1 Tax=Mytilus coruscus TaxID=42192 RepID=A0A6J8BUG8_MYTCO|nr:unnamed protein product [Mytilus coruscus]